MSDEKQDDFSSLKDITEDVITIDSGSPAAPVTGTGAAKVAPALPAASEEKGDHPGIALLDIAIEESVRYCEREHMPPPNLSLWHNFSRGFLNKSLWHYFPSGAEPESPAICALIGVAGLAVCYTPVIMAWYQKKKEELAAEDAKRIEAHNQKVAEVRAARRARGEDPNTGKAMNSHAPGQNEPAPAETPQQPDDPDPEIPPEPAAKTSDLFMTTAKPIPSKIRNKIEAAEPAGPGMS